MDRKKESVLLSKYDPADDNKEGTVIRPEKLGIDYVATYNIVNTEVFPESELQEAAPRENGGKLYGS